jgi:hypothetical protein
MTIAMNFRPPDIMIGESPKTVPCPQEHRCHHKVPMTITVLSKTLRQSSSIAMESLQKNVGDARQEFPRYTSLVEATPLNLTKFRPSLAMKREEICSIRQNQGDGLSPIEWPKQPISLLTI